MVWCFSVAYASPQGAAPGAGSHASAASSHPVLKITLADAIQRAKKLNPVYHLAVTNAEVAAETSKQARDANLPSVSYDGQYLYTQGNRTLSGIFIANNGVHEYIAQGDAREILSATNLARYRSSIAAAALASDQAEIASRGLVVTVVMSYAGLVAAESELKTLGEAEAAARKFVQTTQALEQGGQVAKADVIKAQILLSDSEVALENAKPAEEQARAALALLIFPDVNQPFELVDNPGQTLSLPSFAQAEAEARSHNPAIQAARDAKREASANVTAAWAGYLPTLTLDYFYGIDANRFATFGVDPTNGQRIRNLGYSAWAQLNLPIWNWGATESRVRAAKDVNRQAALDLSFADRKLTANLRQLYSEAVAAKKEIQIRESAAANAVESQKLTLLQFKAGQATALEVVNAEQTVSLERNALATAETRYAVAIANLATLTGSL